jgi:RNA polymerase sigma factor (sigma-70 family)
MASLSLIIGECRQGSAEAYLQLDREMRPRLIASLRCRGASPALAEDLTADVLSECSLPGDRSLLCQYTGKHEFESWLMRVCINRLIDRQRHVAVVQRTSLEELPYEMPNPVHERPDGSLRRIVHQALGEAFASCDAQVRVLLWLVYGFEVKQSRLAAAWGWSESRISRTLSAGGETIRQRTLRRVAQIEPGLTLLWEDIVGVCGEESDSLFGHFKAAR